jgi:hypothetical protein
MLRGQVTDLTETGQMKVDMLSDGSISGLWQARRARSNAPSMRVEQRY